MAKSSSVVKDTSYTEFNLEDVEKILSPSLYGSKLTKSKTTETLPIKIRSIDHGFEKGIEKKHALLNNGVNHGTLTSKSFKESHTDLSDDIFYRKVLFKKLYDPSEKGPDKEFEATFRLISEVLSTYLYNLANIDNHKIEPTKVFFVKGADKFPQVGIRFHKDFKTFEDLIDEKFDISIIDQGKAIAQNLWLGDADAHKGNIGVTAASDKAIRIDFDLSLMSSVNFIIKHSFKRPDLYPYFSETLYKESFVEEVSRLSSMSYHDSPQLKLILNSIFRAFDEHSRSPLSKDTKFKIESDIERQMKYNCINMKFLAEVAKLNLIIKKTSDISDDDLLIIKEVTEKLISLQKEFPKYEEQALNCALNIFDPNVKNIYRRNEILDAIEEHDTDLADLFSLFIKNTEAKTKLFKSVYFSNSNLSDIMVSTASNGSSSINSKELVSSNYFGSSEDSDSSETSPSEAGGAGRPIKAKATVKLDDMPIEIAGPSRRLESNLATSPALETQRGSRKCLSLTSHDLKDALNLLDFGLASQLFDTSALPTVQYFPVAGLALLPDAKQHGSNASHRETSIVLKKDIVRVRILDYAQEEKEALAFKDKLHNHKKRERTLKHLNMDQSKRTKGQNLDLI